MADPSNAGPQFVIRNKNVEHFQSMKYPTKERAEADVLIAQAYHHANGGEIPDLYVDDYP